MTPTIAELKPGDNVMYCEWIEAPQDTDRQIVDTTGYQSLGGHHVALYATSAIEAVGTSRPCTTRACPDGDVRRRRGCGRRERGEAPGRLHSLNARDHRAVTGGEAGCCRSGGLRCWASQRRH